MIGILKGIEFDNLSEFIGALKFYLGVYYLRNSEESKDIVYLKSAYEICSLDSAHTKIQYPGTSATSFFYVPDDVWLEKLIKLLPPDEGYVLEKVVQIETDIIYLKNDPKYKYRYYLKGAQIKNHAEILTRLHRALRHVKNPQYQFSPTLSNLLHDGSTLTRMRRMRHEKYHFIEFNDGTYKSYFHLQLGKALGKLYEIKKEPN